MDGSLISFKERLVWNAPSPLLYCMYSEEIIRKILEDRNEGVIVCEDRNESVIVCEDRNEGVIVGGRIVNSV